MAYYIDLFSPETYQAFSRSDRSISGFRARHQGLATRIQPRDVLVCYVTKLSRWVGLLSIREGPFEDKAPIFATENDPFIVWFRVETIVWLDLDRAIPIRHDPIWNGLSFTRELQRNSNAWTGKVRSSLVRLNDADGAFLANCLKKQAEAPELFPIDDHDRRSLATHTVIRSDKVVSVSVPHDTPAAGESPAEPELEMRESIRIQALIARIGHLMGLSIWIPRSDRERVLREWKKPRCGSSRTPSIELRRHYVTNHRTDRCALAS
jgi:hypothetical protein